MKKIIIYLSFAAALAGIFSCSHTRVEQDVYTITERDTVYRYYLKNSPVNRDDGVIFPSSREIRHIRQVVQRDSVVTREYPDFIRLGLFESVGITLSGKEENSLGLGLFGLYPDFSRLDEYYRGSPDNNIQGGIYRIGIVERRLRWFQDAKNWTYGTSAFEWLIPDARGEKALMSLFPIYVRKRYFLREEIPYIAVTPAFGFGWWPSQYVNLSGSLDVGSIGGLNVRAYVGLAAGLNMANSPQVRNSDYADDAVTSIFPYAGIGVSVLDFLNLVPETETEWKYHEHSSWNVGLLQAGFLFSGSENSVFTDPEDIADPDKEAEQIPITGYFLRIANASVALPIFDYKLYAGVSLFNLIAVGSSEWGAGILPLRVGFWQTVLADELSTEPFIEYNYYPSSFVHIGNRLNLRVSETINLSLAIGYVSGETGDFLGDNLSETFGMPGEFSRAYFGFGFGLNDRIFYPKELRYNK